MDNKYYTPSLAEFHACFRFETVSAKSWQDGPVFNPNIGWYVTDVNYLGFNLDKIEKAIQNNSVRVKYLDTQDIEELGWEEEKGDGLFYIGTEFTLLKTEHDQNRVVITKLHPRIVDFDRVVFDGEIKNYNELKFIMNKVGIFKTISK
jgi:hypothetical protein